MFGAAAGLDQPPDAVSAHGEAAPVNSSRCVALGDPAPLKGGRGRRIQFVTNCICVPASSMMSPLDKGTESAAMATPLTTGRLGPSTCAKT